MCGIAGIVCPNNSMAPEALGRMVGALHHRGPDGHGTHAFDGCLLGHVRLSIVDIEGGAQPMLSADRKLGITFNGEIYGFREIRSRTEYAYRTHSDTEVILALYEQHGADLFSRLPGMFAFALWDDRRKVLLGARDRFGEKPFYYAWGEHGEFIFASEIKAILATGLITPRLDHDALAHYLRKLYVPVGRSIYANIHSLPPGHYFELHDGHLKIAPYWRLPLGLPRIDPDEASARFEELLRQAVQRQLVADVEVGAFLSGGLDSTTIVTLAKEFNSDLRTISYGFEDGINELPLARQTAAQYGTRHMELVDREAPIADLLMKMCAVYDEPFADSSNIPTYLISRRVREHVKVVLTGDGGDELLGGYDWYRHLLAEEDGSLFDRMLQKAFRRLRGVSVKGENLFERHWHGNTYFSDEQMARMGIKPAHPQQPAFALSGTLDDALRGDIVDYMPGDVLVKTDRAAMANSLELRAPFLDADLADFCIALPWSLKVSRAQGKEILRSAFSSRWPAGVARAPKRGFGAPVKKWLARPDVTALRQEYLAGSRKIGGLIDRHELAVYAKKGNYQTWILLCLSLWLEESPL